MAAMFGPAVSDAYWLGRPIGQPGTILYSSAAGAVIPETDARYVAWVALGNKAWPWPNDAANAITTAALDDILINYGLPVTGLTSPGVSALLAYASNKQLVIAAGGMTYNLGTIEVPVLAEIDTSTQGRVNLASLALQAVANPAFTTTWYQSIGNVTIDAKHIVTAAQEVLDFIIATYAIESAALAGISGLTPTITTFAEIDALAWPVNS